MDFYIRPVNAGDGAGMNVIRRMNGVIENILSLPSERITRNESYIASMGENKHSFVAVTKDSDGSETIIGCAVLSVSSIARRRHSAGFGIMVHTDYQGMGVGTRLLEALLDIADNWLMLVRVELEVSADNERAIALYKKLGFVIEGRKIKASIRNGQYIDEYIMARVK